MSRRAEDADRWLTSARSYCALSGRKRRNYRRKIDGMISDSRSSVLAALGYGPIIGVAVWYFLGGPFWLRVASTALAAVAMGLIVKTARRFAR